MLDDTFLPFHSLVSAVACNAPETVAVSAGKHSVTYAELDANSNRIARLLLARGLERGGRVVVGLPRGADLITCALGIWKAGGVYLPVDVDDNSRRTADIIAESGAALVLRSSDASTAPLPVHPRLVVDPEDAGSHPADDPGITITAQDAAYVIHTSGSSGRPKGVVVGHAGLANLAHAQREALDIHAGDRVLQFAALTFDASIAEFTLALAHGATLCVYPREDLTPGEPLAGVLRESITHAIVVPSVLAVLTPEHFPRLRLLGVAGEDCPAELVHAWADRHRLANLYGVTECAVWSTYAPARIEDGRVPIGRPVLGTAVRVVDPDLKVVPVGTVGELLLGGVGVAHGYLDQPRLTAERFVEHLSEPPEDVRRWYRTGDLVRELSDGSFLYLGRLDDQIQIRGQRVEPGETETALTALPEVRQATAVAHGEPGGDRRLVAFIVAEPGHTPIERDVRRALSERLPAHLVPSTVVVLDAIPLTPHGKADRAALATRPLPLRVAPPPDDRSHDPGDPGERDSASERARIVAALIAEVLDIPAIGIHDNFFDQGGHSLNAADLLSHVHRRFGVHVGLGAFFTDPTADGLAEQLGDAVLPHRAEGRRPA